MNESRICIALDFKTKSDVENFLKQFEGESLYGKSIEVELLKFIRPEITFNSVEELKRKMDEDLDYIREEIKRINLQSI